MNISYSLLISYISTDKDCFHPSLYKHEYVQLLSILKTPKKKCSNAEDEIKNVFMILVSWDQLDLEYSHNCKADYLEVKLTQIMPFLIFLFFLLMYIYIYVQVWRIVWYECSMKLRNVKYDARYQREYLEQYACNDKPEMNTGFFYQVIVIFSLFTGRRFWLSTPTDLWTSPQHNSVILGNFCKSRTQL